MALRPWSSKKSEAQKSLEALQRGEAGVAEKDLAETLADVEDEIFVSVTSNPSDRSPGSPLTCLNEGGLVRVGDRVRLSTSFTKQETHIVAITQDGVAAATLDHDERGEVVLSDDTDLSEVYRTSVLTEPDTEDDEMTFLVQVHSAEQRGRDVYVLGRASGDVTPEVEAVVSPWTDPSKRFAKIVSVDHLPDGQVGLLLAKRDASTLEHGDEIVRYKDVHR
jgi:hypothetical protein